MAQYFDFQERTASMQHSSIKSVQAWKSKKTPSDDFPIQESNANKTEFRDFIQKTDYEPRTAMAPTGAEAIRRDGKEPYEFSDVLDIINPLQHLPIVNVIYREITGDEIKPASQIIGGGIYGGPVGAVSGTINAIAQVQTGKDVSENILTIAGIDSGTNAPTLPDDPEARLNAVAATIPKDNKDDLPGTALAFVNLSEAGKNYTKTHIADGRTAGHTYLKQPAIATYNPYDNKAPIIDDINLDTPLPARERITSVSLSAMPPARGF